VRFSFDPEKSQKLKRSRGRTFVEVQDIFFGPHYEDQRNDDPEQWRAIGWSKDQLYTVIYEEREDEQGMVFHLVTLWKATTQELDLYEKNR
jgi:uncharacterized DUF497 family protein